ncbi:MAG: small ribosomal subunit protein uS7 [Gaiellaceae bacterium]
MPRRAEITPRPVIADPVYDSALVTQLMNRVMLDGKKSTAEAIVYTALDKVGEKTGRPPVEVPQRRGRTLARRWIVTFSRDRREKHMADKLAGESLDALEQQWNAFKRKDDRYRMAQANKAFAHYRW